MSETEPIDRPASARDCYLRKQVNCLYSYHGLYRSRRLERAGGGITEIAMSDLILPKAPGRARGRPFEKGRSGNPGGRRRGSRNKATLAAAALLAGEAD